MQEKYHNCICSPILIGSPPSSGSTLLSMVLDAHPQIICGPELSLFSHPFVWSEEGNIWQKRLLKYLQPDDNELLSSDWTLQDGCCPYVQLVYEQNLVWYQTDIEKLRQIIAKSQSAFDLTNQIYLPLIESKNKKIWAEKSPPNLYSMSAFLQRFPEGHGIIVMRDGRDIVCSLMKRGLTFNESISIWLVESAWCIHLLDHPRVKLIRYEDLISNPHQILEDLTKFLEISPEIDEMLRFYEKSDRVNTDKSIHQMHSWKNQPYQPISNSSVGRWKEELTNEQLAVFALIYLNSSFSINEKLIGYTGAEILNFYQYDLEPIGSINLEKLNYILLEFAKLNNFHSQYITPDYQSILKISQINQDSIQQEYIRQFNSSFDLTQENQKLIRDNQKLVQENQKLIRDNQKLVQENQKLIQEHQIKSLQFDSLKLEKEYLAKYIKRKNPKAPK